MIFGAMVLLGAAFILLGSALTFIYPKETSDHYDNLRCVQLKENDEGFEECVKWERAKTRRSRVVNESNQAQLE